jgi:histidinol dehydrogenase
MVGNHTPTALGDFAAGPSHVLPTAGTGRFLSGLRVADFLRRTSVIRYDEASLRRAAPVVTAFAQMEQLEAHGRSATLRVGGPRRSKKDGSEKGKKGGAKGGRKGGAEAGLP